MEERLPSMISAKDGLHTLTGSIINPKTGTLFFCKIVEIVPHPLLGW
jgi:hypothetical protein